MTQEGTTELVVTSQDNAPAVMFAGMRPADIVAFAVEVADAIAPVIEKQKLWAPMGRDREGNLQKHVTFEGWQVAGTMLQVYAHTVWTRQIMHGDVFVGFEAKAEAKTRDGATIATAEAMCTRGETMHLRNGGTRQQWADATPNQIRSMAQTRAGAKALRFALSFVVKLAGYAVTPAEEMDNPEGDPLPDGAPYDDGKPASRQEAAPEPLPWLRFFPSVGKTAVECVELIRQELPNALQPENEEEAATWPKVPDSGKAHEKRAARDNELQRAAAKLTSLEGESAFAAQEMIRRLAGRRAT